MVDLLEWRVVLRSSLERNLKDLPDYVLTIMPQFRHEGVPDEIGLLLPTNEGPKRLIDAVTEEAPHGMGVALGLFLANPFLNLDREAGRLLKAGVRWVVNLPSVEQQDEEFTQQLADVGLDRTRELDCLMRFRAAGFRTMAVVADGTGAAQAVTGAPEILIVMPRVSDFAAGFPSARQRGAAAIEVAETVEAEDWNGIILGLGDWHEADHERLWPDRLTGLLCRPQDFRGANPANRKDRTS